MNLIDATIIDILSMPTEKYGKFWLWVRVDGYGRVSDTELMFNSYADAMDVQVGDICHI